MTKVNVAKVKAEGVLEHENGRGTITDNALKALVTSPARFCHCVSG